MFERGRIENLELPWHSVLDAAANTLAQGVVHRVYLWSANPGTGKSTYPEHFANKLGRKVYRSRFTKDSTHSEMIGHFVLEGMTTKVQDGPATAAARNGGVWICDEFHLASSSVQAAAHAVLDDMEIAEILLPDGEVVKPKREFLAFLTGNEHPATLPEPVQDRFDIVLRCEQPHPKAMEGVQHPMLNQLTQRRYTRPPQEETPADGLNVVTVRKMRAVQKLLRAGLDPFLALRLVYDEYANYVYTELCGL